MRDTLFFYTKDEYRGYKNDLDKRGITIKSVLEYILNEDETDTVDPETEYIDFSVIQNLNNSQFNAERIIDKFPIGVVFIADRKYKDFLSHELRFCFERFENLYFEHNDVQNTTENKKTALKKIINLQSDELIAFFKNFNLQLHGHSAFKRDFENLVKQFILFNKLKEHKILSIFLMGDSGVGKTEVARIIHKLLGGEKKLAKINFGNYSGENALSSLIGSPRGYIGSEDGEIFMRVASSDTGVLLIDEFEKSNATLFNYFLDVLENGSMSSSLGEDIDLDGFIIIFTSNIQKEHFPIRMSAELRSRFNYKANFTPLSDQDKLIYTRSRIDAISKKYNEVFTNTIVNSDRASILSKIKISSYTNLRELNLHIRHVFAQHIEEFH